MAQTIETAIKRKKLYRGYEVKFLDERTIYIRRGHDTQKFGTPVENWTHAKLECINQARDYIDDKNEKRIKMLYEVQTMFIWLVICTRNEALYFVDQLKREDKQALNRFLSAAEVFTKSLEKTTEKPENAELEQSSELIIDYIRKTMLVAKRALFAGKGDDFETFLDAFEKGSYQIKKFK